MSQSFTPIFTSKSFALSAAIDCSAIGELIVTLGSFFGASEGVAGPNATSGSAEGAGVQARAPAAAAEAELLQWVPGAGAAGGPVRALNRRTQQR